MIDEYIKEQKRAVTILKNAVLNNKIGHAYLIETNGYLRKENFTLSFVKLLLCPHSYSNSENCQNCNQCKVIEDGNFLEVRHIYPDGMWIKKEQLQDLQQDFNQTAVLSKKRIYIIHNAEKMNSSSANSILKFLEEPESNIIAILTTDNIHMLMDTIVSRCQIITLNRNMNISEKKLQEKVKLNIEINEEINELTEEEINEKIGQAIKFLELFENNKINTVLYTQKEFHNHFQTKNLLVFALEIMNLFYLDAIRYKTNKQIDIFNDYEDKIKEISKKNNLTKRINVILNIKDLANYNANSNLLIDRLIMDLERCDDNE